MSPDHFNPANILVIDFGQLGDVVLSLPALRAIRERFPSSKITVAVGKAASPVVTFSGYADETLTVDRVALRDGFTLTSIVQIFKLVGNVRSREFDFVIDLHSLSETNLLGFLSGAGRRLYSRRPGRSLDFLSNFHPRPPLEAANRDRHLIDRYLDVLIPLGVKDADRFPRLRTKPATDKEVEEMLRKVKAEAGAPLVGLFPGAGHPSRRWPLEKFAELADFLMRNDQVKVLVFAGPEEKELVAKMRKLFPKAAVILNQLNLSQLISALARLAVLVSNDTGPMHLAAAAGTPVLVLLDKRAPTTYMPLGDHHRKLNGNVISEISVEEAYEATRSILAAGRTAALFAS